VRITLNLYDLLLSVAFSVFLVGLLAWCGKLPKEKIGIQATPEPTAQPSVQAQPEREVTLANFLGCDDLGFDQGAIDTWLSARDFHGELRIFILPSPRVVETRLTGGTFSGTNYGAEITLDGSGLGTASFDEAVDHEFGHLAQYLEAGAECFQAESGDEVESYAETFAVSNDLRFIGGGFPLLTATDDGESIGRFFYRLDGGVPTLYIFDEGNTGEIYLIIDGKMKLALPVAQEGWHAVPADQFEAGLAIYNGKCVRLE